MPPTIPTSFVPHSAAAAPRRFSSGLVDLFAVLSYAVFGIVFLLAVGVFFYGQILKSNQASKDAALAQAVKGIDPTTVETFVRLRDRLTSGQTLLQKHVAFSAFFSTFEKLLPASVRFTELRLSMNDAGVASLNGAGTAKSFNGLAAASNALAQDGRIKDAIFSNISVKSGVVSFVLSAKLDPSIIEFSPVPPVVAPEPIAPEAIAPTESVSAPATTGSGSAQSAPPASGELGPEELLSPPSP